MAGKIKIKLQDTAPPRVVTLDPDATEGADLGVNLRYNGVVLTVTALAALLGTGSTTTNTGPTLNQILTTNGDLATRNGSPQRLPIGTTDDYLRVVAGLPAWSHPAALTKTDDTNVTLTLGGAPNTSLLQAASLTLGWTGTLAAPRGGTGFGVYVIGDMLYASATNALSKLGIAASGQIMKSTGSAPSWAAPAALTKTDDTNVTLTLGGTPATALINAASITVGWSGTLANSRGGTGTGTYAKGDILYASAANVLSKLPISVTTGQVLTVDATGVPVWAAAPGGTFANPTASIGLTAVNGVATTAMRSDAAPALSQAIAPTWTGKHVFAGLADFTTTGSSFASIGTLGAGAYPGFAFNANGAAANTRRWGMYIDDPSGVFSLAAFNDAGAYGTNLLSAARTTTQVTTITLGDSGSNVVFPGTTSFNGPITSAPSAVGGVPAIGATTYVSLFSGASGYATVRMVAGGAAADNRAWYTEATPTGDWYLAALNDAASTANLALTVSRSGANITTIAYGNTTNTTVPHKMNGVLRLISPSPTTFPSSYGVWDAGLSTFGPNAAASQGAAVGIGYDSVADAGIIATVAPGVAWKTLGIYSSAVKFYFGGSLAYTLNAATSTGGATATGLSATTNKPGSNAVVVRWLTVEVGGSPFYIPMWA